jgi:co-chaperonin GroES (HSP10)|tara:strand:- start:220 stop:693 length:474 start_codon:yes stop_codon:yes gene_type:complete
MTKTLYVPDHVLEPKKEVPKKDASSAYINKSEKVLDPSLVGKNLKERLPQPTGWRLLVMPYMGKATTEGGIHIPDAIRDREALATVVAYVLKVGPLAYQDKAKFGEEDIRSWCKEGDWVCIGRYAGARFKIEGGEVRIINDDEVIATIHEPDDIKHI